MSFKLSVDLIEWNMKAAQKVSDPIKEVIQDAIKASCTIYVKTGKEQWTGSGFHLGNGYIATAGHVAPEDLKKMAAQIIITFDGQALYEASVVVSSDEYDSAVLFCQDIVRNIPSVNLADSDTVEIGDIIAVIGAPEGWQDTATVGRVSNIHQSVPGDAGPSWQDIIFIDADILQGVSGGMVIGTDGLVIGHVIGVTGQHADVGVGENSVCPINKLKILLNSISSV